MRNSINALVLLLLTWVLVTCSLGSSSESYGEQGENPWNVYDGETSLEERIINSPVVVRAVLDSVTSEVVAVSDYDEYAVVLKLHLTVREYLNGSGANDIIGVWPSADWYESRAEAEADRAALVAQRDTLYDDLEAIFFLSDDFWVYGEAKADNTYYIDSSRGFSGDPWSSTIDVRNMSIRLWLPTSSDSTVTGDDREYLLALPGTNLAGSDQFIESSTSTISLGSLKSRIAAVNANLNASEGTAEDRRECWMNKYKTQRIEDTYRVQTGGREPRLKARETSHSVESGAPAGTLFFSDVLLRDRATTTPGSTTWLEGEDAAHFEVIDDTTSTPGGMSNNIPDYFAYNQWFRTLRPLPSGTYEITVKNESKSPVTRLCFEPVSFDWTVTATDADGSTHEFFFDPVRVGSSVVADATNGVLKPASFTGATGSSATIGRISWESGVVKVEVTPDDALAGQVVDFIEIDGTVSLSLKVADATVDARNDTLSWSVSSQPWESGDKLMARVRRAPPSCSGGVAVPNPASSPDLVRDCETLLWVEEILTGTSTLNWGEDTPISSWDGVTVGGIPRRVTGIGLTSRGLNGSIPPALIELDKLSSLDVGSNGLTGEIPSELGGLTDLARLRLSGNRFTGCIPAALRDVSDHDLDTLGLDYCAPPAPVPQGLSVSLSNGEFAIGWDMVSWVDRYRVQYRHGGSMGVWTGIGATVGASLTFSPVGGPVCETTYEFRVQARGDGTTWAAEWGEPSNAVSVTTGLCNHPPVFDRATYAFAVPEDAATSTVVGTVSASDPDVGDRVTYRISAGNADGSFAVATSTGRITVADPLDHETAPSFTLTVEATDGKEEGTASTTVGITVTDVAEDPPPAPEGVGVTAMSDGSFGVTWTAVTGADLYRVRYRMSGDGWSDVGTTTNTGMTVSPSGASQCGSVYELGVRARGDGVTYIPVWGAEAVATSTRGGPCNSAPAFSESSYSFSIARNAPAGVRVGTVSAGDPDGDTVSYSISAGNADGRFAVATSTGRITVAGTLDGASVSSYSLTVDASDGNGGTATTGVDVSVATSSACYMGTVVPNVSAKPILARDCEILLSVRDTLAGTSTLNWSASTTISTWDGVTLRWDVDGVQSLYLTDRDLNGSIPAGLGELENLTRLDLDENRLTGSIPPELARLSSLSYLFLFRNMLSGGIPAELGSISSLREIDVSENPLSGEIPPELGNLSSLERLALESNRLTGEIPPELGSLSALTELWLRYNGLSGEIPSELQGLSNLTDLFVSSNSFTGCIPIGLRDVNEHDLDKLGLPYCAPPSAPRNLTASTTHDRITLSWVAPAGSFVTGYQVLRRRPDHGETDLMVHVADTGNADTTYTDTDVGPGTRYVYRVKAINSAGIGPYSRPVTATTARAP